MPFVALNPHGEAASPHGGELGPYCGPAPAAARDGVQHGDSRAAVWPFRELAGGSPSGRASRNGSSFAGASSAATAGGRSCQWLDRGLDPGDGSGRHDRASKSGEEPQRAIAPPMPGRGGRYRGGIELNNGGTFMLSVALPMVKTLSQTEVLQSPLVVDRPCRRAGPLAHRHSAISLTTPDRRWTLAVGPERLLEANHTAVVHASARSVLSPGAKQTEF